MYCSYILTPKVLFNMIWVLEVLVTLDKVSIFIPSFQIFDKFRKFKKVCGNLIFTK